MGRARRRLRRPLPTRSLDAAEPASAHTRGHPMLAAFKRPRAYRFVDETPAHRDRQEAPLQDPRAGARGRRRRPARASVTLQRCERRPGDHRDRSGDSTRHSTFRRAWRRLLAGESGVGPITAVRRLVHAGPNRRRGARLRRRERCSGPSAPGARRGSRSWRSWPPRARRLPTRGCRPAPASSRSPTTSVWGWSSTPRWPGSRRPRQRRPACCAEGVRGVSPYYVP